MIRKPQSRSKASVGDYRIWLMDEFSLRREKNSSYSLRAFARDLGVSPTCLSEVLAKKRDFSRKNVLRVSEHLSLSPVATNSILAQAGLKADKLAEKGEFNQLTEDTFKVISDWYCFAIVDLCKLGKNKLRVSDETQIAKRLGISTIEAKNALARLKRLGLIEEKNGALRATTTTLSTTRDIPSSAIRKYHKQNLHLAEKSIELDPLNLREFSSITIPADLGRLPEVKDMIMEFKRKIARFLETNNSTEVYTLAIQLFPVSRPAKGETPL